MEDMPDRYGYPPDEPVIGAPPPPPLPRHPAPPAAFPGAAGEDDGYVEEDEYWDDDSPYDDGYDDEYEYYQDTPARQPMFYVFIALAVLVGAAAVFLLYTIVNGGEEDTVAAVPPTEAAKAQVRIDAPTAGTSVETGKDVDVLVTANATEPLAKFQLLLQDTVVDEVPAPAPGSGSIYTATLRLKLDKRGEYTILVRVTTQSGTTKDSDRVRITAKEPINTPPAAVKGKVTTTVTLRKAPADSADAMGTLNRGQEVTVTGKTQDTEWLFVDANGGGWIRKAGLEITDSLALVPVRTETPSPTATTPPPTVTAVPSPSPSPTATPANAPDFVPTDARLVDGGAGLEVTVQNASGNAYSGSLVISVKVGGNNLSRAFGITLAANASTTMKFELGQPVTTNATVDIKLDPDNAIRELKEDNNNVSIVLSAPVEQPKLTVTATLVGNNVEVTIANSGGSLAAPDASVVITLITGGVTSRQELPVPLAIPKGGQQKVTLPKPQGSGSATIQVLVGGQPIATGTVQIP